MHWLRFTLPQGRYSEARSLVDRSLEIYDQNQALIAQNVLPALAQLFTVELSTKAGAATPRPRLPGKHAVAVAQKFLRGCLETFGEGGWPGRGVIPDGCRSQSGQFHVDPEHPSAA